MYIKICTHVLCYMYRGIQLYTQIYMQCMCLSVLDMAFTEALGEWRGRSRRGNRELNNGRFAMFAFLGIVSAELYTGNSAIGQFATAPVKAAVQGGAFCGKSLAKRERAQQSRQSRRAFDGASLPGAIAPLGYFDPLGLSGSQERFDKVPCR